jgi:hypothetical protein
MKRPVAAWRCDIMLHKNMRLMTAGTSQGCVAKIILGQESSSKV